MVNISVLNDIHFRAVYDCRKQNDFALTGALDLFHDFEAHIFFRLISKH